VSEPLDRDALWPQLTSFSDTYTCYSAALATWVACERADWRRVVNPGLWLTVGARPQRRFAFTHFPPRLRATLGLNRTATDATDDAVAGVLEEVRRSGRVIVAGDGFQLPWHVAFTRRHVPHWYVLVDAQPGLELLDPFACRNELGVQAANRREVSESDLAQLLIALPGDDPVLSLRESLAFGDQTEVPSELPYQWFARGSVGEPRAPAGAHGPDAIDLLASHFRAHGQDASAYGQADDVWSIARHRAFLTHHAATCAAEQDDAALSGWVSEHLQPLARRWGHMAPLLMQATLALGAGRAASASVPDALERLAQLERAAALALPANSFSI
jgi:hypothetical protein